MDSVEILRSVVLESEKKNKSRQAGNPSSHQEKSDKEKVMPLQSATEVRGNNEKAQHVKENVFSSAGLWI